MDWSFLNGRKYLNFADTVNALLSAEGISASDPAYLDKKNYWKERLIKAIQAGQLQYIDNFPSRPDPSIPPETRYLITGDLEAWYKSTRKQADRINFERARTLLEGRLKTNYDEIAMWLWMGDDGLIAYRDQQGASRFQFAGSPKSDKSGLSLYECWFNPEDIERFQPDYRWLSFNEIVKRWEPVTDRNGVKERLVAAPKAHKSRHVAFEPLHYLHHPEVTMDVEKGLYQLSIIEELEKENGWTSPPGGERVGSHDHRFGHSTRQISDHEMRNQLRLKKKINDLQKKWDLLNEKLSGLNEQWILETRVEERLRLKKSIDDTKTQCDQVEVQLKDMESELVKVDSDAKEVAGRNNDQGRVGTVTNQTSIAPTKPKRTRQDRLTKAILEALSFLRQKLEREPIADEVFNYLADRDETGIIADSTDDKLCWTDTKGKVQETTRKTLANRLSRLNQTA